MNEAQTVEVDAASPPEAVATRGHYGPRITDPVVRYGELDGEPVVYVPLSGRGYGRDMILSAERWMEVVRQWGSHWLLVRQGPQDRIVGTSLKLTLHVGLRSPLLSRLLTGAKRGQKVKHVNGNTLDLRDSNLVVVDPKPKPLKTPKASPRSPKKTAQPKVSTVELTPLAKLSLGVLKLKGHARSNAAVVETALGAAVMQMGTRADTGMSVTTPMARQALDNVKALLGRKEGREVSDGEAVAYSVCEAAAALSEEAKGSLKMH